MAHAASSSKAPRPERGSVAGVVGTLPSAAARPSRSRQSRSGLRPRRVRLVGATPPRAPSPRRMKRALSLATVVALAAATASPAATPGVRATAPAATGFGDVITYVVEASGDPSASIEAPTAPFTRLGAARLERTGSVVRLSQRVACLDARCLGDARTQRVVLPAPRARIGSRSIVGSPVSVSVRGRVTRNAVSRGDEAYRRETSLPAAGVA